MAATYLMEAAKKDEIGAQKNEAKQGKESEMKPPRDISKVKCYGCRKKGHLKNSLLCPKNIEKEKQMSQEGREAFMNTTWYKEIEGSIYTMVRFEEDKIREYVADTVVNATQGITLTQVLLDSQADISVMHPILLQDIKPTKKKIGVSGVGGMQLIANQVGILHVFFSQVYARKKTKANVLSFAEVEVKFNIMYRSGKLFTVHMPIQDVVFKRKNKLYMAEWCAEDSMPNTAVNATVQENECYI
jgi:hypothetical protein